MTSEIIFESNDLLVRWTPAGDGRRIVVTFDHHHHQRTLDREGFGQEYFAGRDISAIHVITLDNDWFQYPEMPQALSAIRKVTTGAKSVMTYGSSMGGYAAIRFADAVGANAALALSPQYSIDPVKVPFETRWRFDMKRLKFLDAVDGPICSAFPPVVAYDPNNIDRLHVEQIAKDINIIPLRAPYGGHPVGSFLNDLGLLSPMLESILDGNFDPKPLEMTIRARRRTSVSYLSGLALRQPPSRPKMATALAYLAIAQRPERPELHFALAKILAAAGRHGEALEAYKITNQLEEHPGYLYPYGEALFNLGHLADALAVASRCTELWPTAPHCHKLVSQIYQARGELAQALESERRAHLIDPRNNKYRWHIAKLKSRIFMTNIAAKFRSARPIPP